MEFAGLYGEPHDLDRKDRLDDPALQTNAWDIQEKPSRAFLETWIGKVREDVELGGSDALRDTGYKNARTLIHDLIDNVSKNGYLLWLAINGEAIYRTTPWMSSAKGQSS